MVLSEGIGGSSGTSARVSRGAPQRNRVARASTDKCIAEYCLSLPSGGGPKVKVGVGGGSGGGSCSA